MIILIVGDFGVGKDTFADFMLDYLSESVKIKSYTTRKPRFEGEDTHIFVSHKDISSDVLAYIDIEGTFYWTCKSQFDKTKNNIYVIDDCGLQQVIESNFDNYIIIEINRPKSLIEVDNKRLNRKKDCFFNYRPLVDFSIANDCSIEELEQKANYISRIISLTNGLL